MTHDIPNPINGSPELEPHVALAAVVGPAPHEPQQRRKKKRSRHKPNTRVPALNITSFLDMSFALLTFLILGASFGLGEGSLSAKLPKGEGGGGQGALEDIPTVPLTLLVNPGRTADEFVVTFDGVQGIAPTTSFEDLTQKLRQLRFDAAENPSGILKPDHVMTIKPSADVSWQGVIQAFNAAQRARFQNVAIAKLGS